MADISRLTATWSQWPGAPGITQLYSGNGSPTQAMVDGFRGLFQPLVAYLPSGLTVQVNGSGDVFDDATGLITGVWSVGTTPAPTIGSGTGNYAGNAGAVINWLTSLVHGRRRLRGRTFMVPLVSAAYDTQGSLSSACITALQTGAAAMIAGGGGEFVVWSQPKPDGSFAVGTVNGFKVPDLAATLRSRRT